MDEAILQAYGRLTAHEFFLEIMYANWLGQMPAANATRLLSDLQNRVKKAYSAPDADQTTAENFGLQIMQDAEHMSDRFLQKVEKRANEIRAELSRNPFRT